MNLKNEIHAIQDGIENIHGDVEYGERQYLFLFKKWVNQLLGDDIAKGSPAQMMYQGHPGFRSKSDKTKQLAITVWVESEEYARGYNARSAEARKKMGRMADE